MNTEKLEEEIKDLKEALSLARTWVWRDPEKHTNHPEQAYADIRRVNELSKKWGWK